MKRLALLLFSIICIKCAAQIPIVRAHLEPSRNITVGQPVRLVVSVFAPNYFTGSPEFPEFEIENAIDILPQHRPQNSNTQISGATYFGITQTYIIYPQQAGSFHVPPVLLTVPYAIAPPKNTTATLAMPSLEFHADLPAAAKDLAYFLPTTKLTITQRWSRSLVGLRAGDAVERTIIVTASKMQSMLIPPLPFEQPHGIRIYTAQPTTDDMKTDRGDFIHGQRIESAKYLLQKEGDYILAPIELKWWNLSTHRLVTTALPEVKFSVAANPNYVTELPPPQEQTQVLPISKVHRWKTHRATILFWVIIVATLGLLFISRRYLLTLAGHLKNWRKHRRESEAAYFRNLQQACHRNDPAQSYRCLLEWRQRIDPNQLPRDGSRLTEDPTLLPEVNHLGSILFSEKNTSSAWNGSNLAEAIKQWRSNSRKCAPEASSLSGLNP